MLKKMEEDKEKKLNVEQQKEANMEKLQKDK